MYSMRIGSTRVLEGTTRGVAQRQDQYRIFVRVIENTSRENSLIEEPYTLEHHNPDYNPSITE